MDQQNSVPVDGAGFFDVDDLLNLIVPFEFEFEGRKLTGTWYRYKTTTPDWIQAGVTKARAKIAEYNELIEKARGTEDRAQLERLRKQADQIEADGFRAKYMWLADALVSWNAVDRKKKPLPISETVFRSLPVPFIVALGEYLASTRTGANPT
jgi:hypothetical protein